VAHICLEQKCEIKHIHPESSHIFVCPAIMTINWRKQLAKQSDSMVLVKEGAPIWPTNMFKWPTNMFEPVMLSLTGPLLSHSPWTMRRSEWVASRKGYLPEMFRSSATASWSYLREFWARAWSGEADVL